MKLEELKFRTTMAELDGKWVEAYTEGRRTLSLRFFEENQEAKEKLQTEMDDLNS